MRAPASWLRPSAATAPPRSCCGPSRGWRWRGPISRSTIAAMIAPVTIAGMIMSAPNRALPMYGANSMAGQPQPRHSMWRRLLRLRLVRHDVGTAAPASGAAAHCAPASTSRNSSAARAVSISTSVPPSQGSARNCAMKRPCRGSRLPSRSMTRLDDARELLVDLLDQDLFRRPAHRRALGVGPHAPLGVDQGHVVPMLPVRVCAPGVRLQQRPDFLRRRGNDRHATWARAASPARRTPASRRRTRSTAQVGDNRQIQGEKRRDHDQFPELA